MESWINRAGRARANRTWIHTMLLCQKTTCSWCWQMTASMAQNTPAKQVGQQNTTGSKGKLVWLYYTIIHLYPLNWEKIKSLWDQSISGERQQQPNVPASSPQSCWGTRGKHTKEVKRYSYWDVNSFTSIASLHSSCWKTAHALSHMSTFVNEVTLKEDQVLQGIFSYWVSNYCWTLGIWNYSLQMYLKPRLDTLFTANSFCCCCCFLIHSQSLKNMAGAS